MTLLLLGATRTERFCLALPQTRNVLVVTQKAAGQDTRCIPGYLHYSKIYYLIVPMYLLFIP